ncbi:MAG TPA: hypothetical protein VNV41_07220 [Candidatus Acidoferrales bacterium]|jgi:hypothetical protein|nr:hypothetical protein [Candidatus Acidoferrales bacterium]
MSGQKRKGGFSLYRFAKKVQGLHKQEKAVLVAIADAAGQLDGYPQQSAAKQVRRAKGAGVPTQLGENPDAKTAISKFGQTVP